MIEFHDLSSFVSLVNEIKPPNIFVDAPFSLVIAINMRSQFKIHSRFITKQKIFELQQSFFSQARASSCELLTLESYNGSLKNEIRLVEFFIVPLVVTGCIEFSNLLL